MEGGAAYAPVLLGYTNHGSICPNRDRGLRIYLHLRNTFTPSLLPPAFKMHTVTTLPTAKHAHATVRIQNAYRHYYTKWTCIFLPLLHGHFTSMPGLELYTDKYASELNDSYHITPPRMYHAWANCHFADLLDYLSLLWSLDSIDWPWPSGTFLSHEHMREFHA